MATTSLKVNVQPTCPCHDFNAWVLFELLLLLHNEIQHKKHSFAMVPCVYGPLIRRDTIYTYFMAFTYLKMFYMTHTCEIGVTLRHYCMDGGDTRRLQSVRICSKTIQKQNKIHSHRKGNESARPKWCKYGKWFTSLERKTVNAKVRFDRVNMYSIGEND